MISEIQDSHIMSFTIKLTIFHHRLGLKDDAV